MIGNGHAGFGRAASEKDPQGHLADVVPRPARARRSARRSPIARATSPPEAIAVAWTAQQRLHRTWTGSKPAPSAARSSRSRPPASSPGLLGDHPNRVTTSRRQSPIPSAGSVAARQRAGNPRRYYEQPAPSRAGHARC